MRSLIFALLKASLLVSEEPMVLMELRLRSLSESLMGSSSRGVLVMLAAVAVMAVGVASGVTSVASWLGRNSSSGVSVGVSTDDSTTDSSTDSVSLSGVSANAANGLGVLTVDVDADAAAVGVIRFGVLFITPVAVKLGC